MNRKDFIKKLKRAPRDAQIVIDGRTDIEVYYSEDQDGKWKVCIYTKRQNKKEV